MIKSYLWYLQFLFSVYHIICTKNSSSDTSRSNHGRMCCSENTMHFPHSFETWKMHRIFLPWKQDRLTIVSNTLKASTTRCITPLTTAADSLSRGISTNHKLVNICFAVVFCVCFIEKILNVRNFIQFTDFMNVYDTDSISKCTDVYE